MHLKDVLHGFTSELFSGHSRERIRIQKLNVVSIILDRTENSLAINEANSVTCF